MKTRNKLIPIVCTTVAVLATASAFVIAYTSNNHVDPYVKKDFVVTFDAGEGQFISKQQTSTEVYAGTHFDEVDQPAVICSGKMFSGWIDSDTNKPIMGRQTVNRNMKLTASYSDVTGEHATVTFSAGDTGATLRGNISVAVNTGYYFFMVNRPSAKLDNSIFTNWVYATGPKTGEVIEENDVIEEDVTLIPAFTHALALTWNGNGAEMVRGSGVSYVQPDTVFRTINQPGFRKGTEIFEGWYKDESCTIPWEPYDQITEDTKAYAKWVTTPGEYYCTIHYIQKPGTEVVPTFAPAINQAVLKDTAWENIFKPTVTTPTGDYKIDHWEYSLDGSTDWITIQNDTEFNYETVYIAPILVPNVEEVYVYGDTTVTSQRTGKFNAFVLGCESQEVTWAVYDEEPTIEKPDPEYSTHAYITSEGLLVAGFIDQTNLTVYVQATSKLDTTKKSTPYPVTIVAPYVNSDKVWYNENNDWYWLEMDQLTDPTSTDYLVTRLSDYSTSYIPKAEQAQKFENDLFIGRNIKNLPDNFLIGWSNFNGNLDFIETTSKGKVVHTKNNVVKIGDSFMEGCTNFNKKLDMSNIIYVGDNFMFDCSLFNNGQAPATNPSVPLLINNSELTHIGSNFMNNCVVFNQPLSLPTDPITPGQADPHLEYIGSYFMYNCLKYSNEIWLASTIQTIDPFFMLNCCSFTSTIILNCESTVFKGTDQQICTITPTFIDPVTSLEVTAPIYSPGFSVSGDYRSQFSTRFPDTASAIRHIYRKSVTGDEQHAVSANTNLKNLTATVDKAVIDENQEFTFTLNNTRTSSITDAYLELIVGSQRFTIPTTIAVGTSETTYSKTIINQMLIAQGGTEMSTTDSITLNIVRLNVYDVSNNKISYIDSTGTATLLTDEQLEELEGRFLIKNAYDEYTLSPEGTSLVNYVKNSSGTVDLTLIYGQYVIEGSDPASLITLKLHGALNSSGAKTTDLIMLGATQLIYLNNIAFEIDHMKIKGWTKDDDARIYYQYGMEAHSLKCTLCDFRGGFTFYSSSEFYFCTFDNRSDYYIDGGEAKNCYSLFMYGPTANARVEQCTFLSGGKAMKFYTDGGLPSDLTSYAVSNQFVYDPQYEETIPHLPEIKSPFEIDASQITTNKYIIYLTSNTMSGYPAEPAIPLYNAEGTNVEIHYS